MLNAVLVRIVEMILQVSLRGLFGMLHPALVVRIRKVGVMVGLLVGGGTVKFGRLPLMASRLSIVLRCRVVVLGAWHGNQKIRLFGVPCFSNDEFCFSRHDIPLLRSNSYGKSSFPDRNIDLLPPLCGKIICSSVQ
jgi:hypothetical protein